MAYSIQTILLLLLGLALFGLAMVARLSELNSLVQLILLMRVSYVPPRKPFPSELTFTTPNSREMPSPLPEISSSAEIVVSVVVPAYNEEPRIKSMLEEAVNYLDKAYYGNDEWEILIVDDGSYDNTSKMALDWAGELQDAGAFDDGQVRVCRLEKNRGKGGAVSHVVLRVESADSRVCNMSVDDTSYLRTQMVLASLMI